VQTIELGQPIALCMVHQVFHTIYDYKRGQVSPP
jgi:hypothetical protein